MEATPGERELIAWDVNHFSGGAWRRDATIDIATSVLLIPARPSDDGPQSAPGSMAPENRSRWRRLIAFVSSHAARADRVTELLRSHQSAATEYRVPAGARLATGRERKEELCSKGLLDGKGSLR